MFKVKPIESVKQKRKTLQEFIKIHFGYIPTFSDNIQTKPIVLSFEEFKIQKKLQKTIQAAIVKFVKNYNVDEKLQEIVPLDEKIKKLFFNTSKRYEAKDIGSYRPDFVYDENSKINICEINARFAVNGYFITDYLTYSMQHLQEFSEFKNTINFNVYDKFLSNFDQKKPIGCLRKREKGFDIHFILNKNVNARTVSPDDLYLKNGMLFDKFGQLDQFIIELHQDEILEIPEKILFHLLNNTKCYNDLRTIFLIHDKRFLKFLTDKELTTKYLSQDDSEFLSKHIINTKIINTNDLGVYLKNHQEWILKPFLRGKGEGILFGKDFDTEKWKKLILENQDSCILQNYISPKLIPYDIESENEIKSYEQIPIVGTFLGMNDEYVGAGIFRISPSDIIAISRGGGVVIPIIPKLKCDLNIKYYSIDSKESFVNQKEIFEHLQKEGILGIQLNFNDDGTFLKSLVSTFGKSQNYWDIKLDSSKNQQICARSKTLKEFDFHTDASFYDPPPEYISIFVVQPDEMGGGIFKMIDIKEILSKLTHEEIELLKEENYQFKVPDEFKRKENWMKGKIILKENSIRYRSDIISRDNLKKDQLNILKKLDEMIDDEANHQFLDLNKNSCLIFDNSRFLHARSEIKDKHRFLKRIQFDKK
eukprot:gene998-9904_t